MHALVHYIHANQNLQKQSPSPKFLLQIALARAQAFQIGSRRNKSLFVNLG